MSPIAPGFPSLKTRRLIRLLQREFGYVIVKNNGGSHRKLKAPDRPTLTIAWKDGDTVGQTMVRQVLVRDVGLTLVEAKEVVKRA